MSDLLDLLSTADTLTEALYTIRDARGVLRGTSNRQLTFVELALLGDGLVCSEETIAIDEVA